MSTQAPVSSLRRRLVVALPLILFAGLAAIFLIRLYGGDPSRLPSALIGKQVPDFKLEPLAELVDDGTPVKGFSSGILYGDKVSLVNIWASWCVPCRAEHPFLMELAKRSDIQVLGLNYKDKPANARRFLGTHGNPYERVGVDPNGRTSVDWGVYGVPETFVVDKKGTIRFKQIGPLTQDSLKRFLPQIEAAKVDLVR
ncbi:MAG: DsbE family thiol:disulfide interchange protein [Alphaproteobacteria bacterium]|nr:DsbE family thiol:disulfide interchange protein [Alphaproteobacteria bacterium]